MFSFIHTADIHLDSPLRGLSQYEHSPEEEIRGATRKALINIVDLAIEKQVDFLIIAGDLYDGDWQDYSTGQFFTNQMRRLKEHHILVYLIKGNHDAVSKITKSLTLPENVIQFSHKKATSHQHPTLPISIHGQSFANQAQQDNIAIDYPKANPDTFNIGILHTSLAGDYADHDPYAPCSVPDLLSKEYQYWALGHIHLQEIVHNSPLIIYSGNPQGRHIKETEERGCYLITVDQNQEITNHEFHPTDVVRWSHLEIDITDMRDPDQILDKVQKSIQTLHQQIDNNERLKLAAFRLTLSGATELHGELHTKHADLQANCHEIAQDIDSDSLWLEQVRLKTKPIYSLEELAERDDLTALLIESLKDYSPATTQSSNIQKLQNKLTGISTKELSTLFQPGTPLQKQQLSEDVAAIVLQSITHSAQ